MPTESTVFNPEPRIFPFVGFPEPQSDFMFYPRSEITYNIKNGLVPNPASALDDQLCSVSCALPGNFAYVVAEVHLQLFASLPSGNANVSDWEGQCETYITETASFASADALWYTEGLSGGAFLGTETVQARRVYQFASLVKKVILPRLEDASLTMNVANPVLNGPDVKINFQARFLTFDISQAHHVAISTPTLIR